MHRNCELKELKELPVVLAAWLGVVALRSQVLNIDIYINKFLVNLSNKGDMV